jgi:tetratricopeptide (TPR) repeat protein
VLSLAAVIVSIAALQRPPQLAVSQKIAVAAFGLAFYLRKTIAPFDLSPLYQLPHDIHPLAPVYLASYLAVAALLAGMWVARRRSPAITACCLLFIVIVLPMLGAVQNGPQIAADRYTYHAAPALAMLGGLLVIRLMQSSFAATLGACVLILAASSALTVRQIAVWRESDSLWTRVLEVDPTSSIAHSSMASLLFSRNMIREATAHSLRAVELDPNDAQAHDALGTALARQGRFAEAAQEFQLALVVAPSSDEVENNWGIVTIQQGDIAGAIAHYQRAVAINPDNADAQVNWGNALVRMDSLDGAMAHYRAALTIRPDHADAHHNWGVALARAGRYGEAVEQFRQALALNPNHVEARAYLERALQLQRGGSE